MQCNEIRDYRLKREHSDNISQLHPPWMANDICQGEYE